MLFFILLTGNLGYLVKNVYKNPFKIEHYFVRTYFNRIRGLPFKSVEIQFYNISIGSNLELGEDDKYHGTINFIQTFV